MRIVGFALAVALCVTVPGLFVGWPGMPEADPASAAAVASDPSLRSVLEWSTQASMSNVAFEVRVDVVQETECRLKLLAAGRTTSGGPEYVMVLRTAAGRGWSAMNSDGLVQVHAGALDTRGITVQRDGDHWAMSSEHRRPGLVGELSWFFAAGGLTPWPGHEWTGADSLRFHFECDAPFRVISILRANEARLMNERSLAEGHTVYAQPVGTLVRDESIVLRMESDHARMLIGQKGNEGVVRIQTPTGQEHLALATTQSLLSFEKGGGDYGLRLDCFCRGSFWAVLADLEPVGSVDALRPTH